MKSISTNVSNGKNKTHLIKTVQQPKLLSSNNPQQQQRNANKTRHRIKPAEVSI